MDYIILTICIAFCVYEVFELFADLTVAFKKKLAQEVLDKINEQGIKYVQRQAISNFLTDALILFIYIVLIMMIIK